MEDLSSVWRLDRLEPLIFSLYDSQDPGTITAAQGLLADFQSSTQAWAVAHRLLERPDEKVKFFGALTIVIKLNKESSLLTDTDAQHLLDRLIACYLNSMSTTNRPLVPRKLASALATFFIHFHRLWPNFIRHLSICISSSRPSSSLPHTVQEESAFLGSLGCVELRAILWVMTNILDDVARLDLSAQSHVALYRSVIEHATDATALMYKALTEAFTNHRSNAVGEDAIKCLESWLLFAQKLSPGDSHVVASLRQLIDPVLTLVPLDTFSGSAVDLLIEILSTYPALLLEKDYERLYDLLVSSWAEDRYQSLLRDGSDFQSVRFGQLLLALGEDKCQFLMRSGDARSDLLLAKLCGLLSARGYPVVENKIFVPALEFWSNFTENLAGSMVSDDNSGAAWSCQAWFGRALGLVSDAVSNAWQKIVWPSPNETNDWDYADRASFSEARKDVVDFLQAVYSLSGPRLVATFVNIVLATLAESAWPRLEAAAFCLAGLAECGEEDNRFDELLTPVFGSSLFSSLAPQMDNVPQRTRQVCLYLIEQYTGYFERNQLVLGPAMRLLFDLLADPSMAPSASRSILRLCSSCRKHLHPDVDSFLGKYESLNNLPAFDCVSAERIAGAVASIVQAVPDHDKKVHASSKLLGIIQEDVSLAQKLMGESAGMGLVCFGQRCWDVTANEHPSLHMAIKALKCLLSVAKGFQSPVEGTIDLDYGIDRDNDGHVRYAMVHEQVIGIIANTEKLFDKHSEIPEIICATLRCGFSETEPGPFTLDTNLVTEYLTSHSRDAPRLGLFVTAACSLSSSLIGRNDGSANDVHVVLLRWMIGLIRGLSETNRDPELSQHSIDFARRLILKTPLTLLTLQPPAAAEFLFLFAIEVLDGNEPLPKCAAADFWTAFIALRGSEGRTSEASSQAMVTLGPLLSQSLVRNVGGRASRSELDKLSEPIKKLFNRYPLARDWFSASLHDSSFSSDRISSEQKELFVKKLVRLV